MREQERALRPKQYVNANWQSYPHQSGCRQDLQRLKMEWQDGGVSATFPTFRRCESSTYIWNMQLFTQKSAIAGTFLFAFSAIGASR